MTIRWVPHPTVDVEYPRAISTKSQFWILEDSQFERLIPGTEVLIGLEDIDRKGIRLPFRSKLDDKDSSFSSTGDTTTMPHQQSLSAPFLPLPSGRNPIPGK